MLPWEYTIAKLFSDAGYATAMYGKWHLGEVQGRLPNDQGFDEWWGIENSWDEARASRAKRKELRTALERMADDDRRVGDTSFESER